jgi:2',3'-cyclic-nucleotide 2'-phosphodiesterase (5'-nucleotidase family)
MLNKEIQYKRIESQLESKNGDYIKVANGDILQGSYVSSKTRGLALIESLNLMDLSLL